MRPCPQFPGGDFESQCFAGLQASDNFNLHCYHATEEKHRFHWMAFGASESQGETEMSQFVVWCLILWYVNANVLPAETKGRVPRPAVTLPTAAPCFPHASRSKLLTVQHAATSCNTQPKTHWRCNIRRNDKILVGFRRICVVRDSLNKIDRLCYAIFLPGISYPSYWHPSHDIE